MNAQLYRARPGSTKASAFGRQAARPSAFRQGEWRPAHAGSAPRSVRAMIGAEDLAIKEQVHELESRATGVTKLFRYPWRTAVLVGTGLTQIGEFSFILVQVAHANGLLGDEFYHASLAASLLSILVNATLVRAVPRCMPTASAARA